MKNISNKNILFIFFLVPAISSILSTIHLVKFAGLANPFGLAILLALTFELGSIVTFIVGSGKNLLKKIKKGYVVVMFLILFILQVFGNVYASYDYIRHQLILDPTWLDTFMDMMLGTLDLQLSKFTVSILMGLPIPLISLILLKSGVDYVAGDEIVEVGEVKENVIEAKEVIEHKEEKPITINKIEEVKQEDKNNTISPPYMQG